MIKIETIDVSKMTLSQLIAIQEDNDADNKYKIVTKNDSGYWRVITFDISNLSSLVREKIPFYVIKIIDLKNVKLENVSEVLPELISEEPEEPELPKKSHSKFTTIKEPEVANKACYAFLASNSTGSISLLPKSNGALRINFNTKEQAEAYLKQFRRRMHYATNSVDYYTIFQFYEDLGLVLSQKQLDLAKNYGWSTVDTLSKLDNWLSPQVTKTTDETGWYGFTISKRASKIYSNKETQVC